MGLLSSSFIDKALKKSILKVLELNVKGDILTKEHYKKFYSVDSSSYQIIPKIIITFNIKNIFTITPLLLPSLVLMLHRL